MSRTAKLPRIEPDEALRLLREASLGELMSRAHEARTTLHPGGVVTFVYDTNPNYTNVCETQCRFCAFCRREGNTDAYTLTPAELAERVRIAVEFGATTVLMQGGHHPRLRLSDWVAYVRAIRGVCPKVHIHPFDPAEVVHMAAKEDTTVRAVLEALRNEGITTLPGGGAEVLVDRVRRLVSPRKCTAQQWLDVMEQAHALGFRTTATLMFGHVETDEDIIEHPLCLRELQDRTGGFQSFIPWSFKPGGSPLSTDVSAPAHPARYVRIIAVARLMLDNFAHVQSSWFSESVSAGQLGLMAGADDFGGILVEENVLRETGFERRITAERLLGVIREVGFTPARRNSMYEVVEVFVGFRPESRS